MYTIRARYDGKNFKPMQAIPIKEDCEVLITFLEPEKKDISNVKELKKLPRSTVKGLLKGKVWMSDDFNEPLEEMKEYME